MSQVGGRTAATLSPAKIDHFRRRARGPPTKIISENFFKKNHQPTHWRRHRPHLPATALLRPPLPPHRRGRSRAAVSPPSAGLHRWRHHHRRVGTVSVVIASTRRGASRMRAVVITRYDRWRSRREEASGGGERRVVSWPAEGRGEAPQAARRSRARGEPLSPLLVAARGRRSGQRGGERWATPPLVSTPLSEPPRSLGVDADVNATPTSCVARGQQRRGRSEPARRRGKRAEEGALCAPSGAAEGEEGPEAVRRWAYAAVSTPLLQSRHRSLVSTPTPTPTPTLLLTPCRGLAELSWR